MMLKNVCMSLLAVGIVGCSNPKSPKITEIAIYRIQAERQPQLPTLLSDFRSEVAKLQGFEDYLTFQDAHNPQIYADVLHWTDAQNAVAASEKVKTEQPFKPFTSAIDSLIAYGDFTSFNYFSNKKKSTVMSNNIKEVVVYQLKADKVTAYAEIVPLVNAFLNNQKGFISREVLQDHKDPTIFADIVEWESLSDASNAMQASQKEATILPFFEATEKVISFSHYNVFK
jgi:heme-degrading monooxygenase HmoA